MRNAQECGYQVRDNKTYVVAGLRHKNTTCAEANQMEPRERHEEKDPHVLSSSGNGETARENHSQEDSRHTIERSNELRHQNIM